jgi:hypothetical protein
VFIVTMNWELMFTGIFISRKDRSSQPFVMMYCKCKVYLMLCYVTVIQLFS